MFSRSVLIVVFVLAILFRAHVQGAELVVMNTDTTTVPGAKVYTVGVQVTQADVTSAIAASIPRGAFYANVPLYFQDLQFTGNIMNSSQTTDFNYRSLQSIQTQYIDPATYNSPVAPGLISGPPTNLGAAGDQALNASSWWYASGDGQIVGVNDSSGDIGPISTTPAADGSGVYTIGATNNIGPLGLDWLATPEAYLGTLGMTMSQGFYGGYGPPGYIDQAPISNQFVNGVLTVPLAQIVTNGNINVGFTRADTFLGVSQTIYNFLGGSAIVDPHAVLDYSTNTIHSLLSAGGGTSTVGGIQIDPTMITTDGTLTGNYSTTTAANLAQTIGAAAAGQINFALAGTTVQLWDVQFTGVLQGTNTVVFHYDPTLIGSTPESDLRIEHFVNGAWVVPAGEVVDTVAHTITVQADSFSPFVLSQVPEPASAVLVGIGSLVACAWRLRAGQRVEAV